MSDIFHVGQIVEHVTFPNFVGIVVKMEGVPVFRLGVLSQDTGQVFYDSPDTWEPFNPPVEDSVLLQARAVADVEIDDNFVIDAEFREVVRNED